MGIEGQISMGADGDSEISSREPVPRMATAWRDLLREDFADLKQRHDSLHPFQPGKEPPKISLGELIKDAMFPGITDLGPGRQTVLNENIREGYRDLATKIYNSQLPPGEAQGYLDELKPEDRQGIGEELLSLIQETRSGKPLGSGDEVVQIPSELIEEWKSYLPELLPGHKRGPGMAGRIFKGLGDLVRRVRGEGPVAERANKVLDEAAKEAGQRLSRLQVFGRPALNFIEGVKQHPLEFVTGMAAGGALNIGVKLAVRELLIQVGLAAGGAVPGAVIGAIVGATREYLFRQLPRNWREVSEQRAQIQRQIDDLIRGGSTEEARELARQKRRLIEKIAVRDRGAIAKEALRGAVFGAVGGALGGAIARVVTELGVLSTGENLLSGAREAGGNVLSEARKNPIVAGAGDFLGRTGEAIGSTPEAQELGRRWDIGVAPAHPEVPQVSGGAPKADILADAAGQIHDPNLSAVEVAKGLKEGAAASVGEHLGDIDKIAREAIRAHGMDPSQLSAEQFEQVRMAVQHAAEGQANTVFADAAAEHSGSLTEAVSSGHDQFGQVLEKSHDQLFESAKGALSEVLEANQGLGPEFPAADQLSILRILREAVAKGEGLEIGGSKFSPQEIESLAQVLERHIDQLADVSTAAAEAHASEVFKSLGGFIPLEAGSNPWEVSAKILKDVLGKTPSPQQIMELDKIICQQNGISVPAWGIPGSIDHRALPVGFPIKIDDTIKNAVLVMVKK